MFRPPRKELIKTVKTYNFGNLTGILRLFEISRYVILLI